MDLKTFRAWQPIQASWGDTALSVVTQMMETSQVWSSHAGHTTNGHTIVSCGDVRLISSTKGSLFMIGDEPVPHPIDDPIVIRALAWLFMQANAKGRAAPEIKLEGSEALGYARHKINQLAADLSAKHAAKQQRDETLQLEDGDTIDGEIMEDEE